MNSLLFLKARIFEDELQNVINLIPDSEKDENWIIIKEYFEKRRKTILRNLHV